MRQIGILQKSTDYNKWTNVCYTMLKYWLNSFLGDLVKPVNYIQLLYLRQFEDITKYLTCQTLFPSVHYSNSQ